MGDAAIASIANSARSTPLNWAGKVRDMEGIALPTLALGDGWVGLELDLFMSFAEIVHQSAGRRQGAP